ncbi:aldo/keto reductase [Lentibacillus sp. N15]|uniref:aldo/keto reductase n=1 Tax=Lentibacillus songyuanensis TaxID=3136161 RepID=UPI0031B9E817
MNTAIIPEFTLNDGLVLPAIGFGTVTLKGSKGVHSIQSAIDAGYRLLDTAVNYDNEGAVGAAVSRSSVPRSELKITSKLPGRYQTYDKAVTAIQESLYRANLNYYDLYLIHWPNPNQDHYVEAWQAMIDAQKWGLIRSIGVCNFLPEHIDRLIQETGVKPSINQIEMHPFFNQEQQRKYHQEHAIQTEAWSPLSRVGALFQHKTLKRIADDHHKAISQVILRWHYQLGSIPIPRSASLEHQQENIAIFDFSLSEAEMSEIAELTRPDGRWNNELDPAVHEEF